MSDYAYNRDFGDNFLDHMKEIASKVCIDIAPIEEDRDRNTDLIVLTAGAVRVGCRTRRNIYEPPQSTKYQGQFTIRYSLPSGRDTELQKILAGWGDYMIYGWGGEKGRMFLWHLLNLDVFREEYTPGDGETHENHDGGSTLAAFSFKAFSTRLIVASSLDPTPAEQQLVLTL